MRPRVVRDQTQRQRRCRLPCRRRRAGEPNLRDHRGRMSKRLREGRLRLRWSILLRGGMEHLFLSVLKAPEEPGRWGRHTISRHRPNNRNKTHQNRNSIWPICSILDTPDFATWQEFRCIRSTRHTRWNHDDHHNQRNHIQR